MRLQKIAAVVAVILAGSWAASAGARDAFTLRGDATKKAMQDGHKSKLLDKVTGGKASDEEKKKLVELYKAMAAEEAPKGDQADWKKKVGDLLSAAEGVASGDKAAVAKLKAASDCKACHSLHKP